MAATLSPPAIIDQFDATTVLPAGQTATVDATATLIHQGDAMIDP